jgi:chromosome segregation ATPase
VVEENQIPWEKVESAPDKEIKLHGRDVLAFKSEIEAKNLEMVKMAAALAEVQADRRKLLTGLDAERSRNSELERKVASLENDYKQRETMLQTIEADAANKVKSLQEKIQDLEIEEQKIQGERDAAAAGLAKVEVALAERESALAVLKGEIDSLQGRTAQLESEKGKVSAHAQADCVRYEQEIRALEAQRDTMKAKLESAEKVLHAASPESVVDDFSTVRACMACREFTLMDESDIRSVRAVKLFDNLHRMHMIGTLTFGEVKGKFLPRTKDLLDRIK